MHQGRNSKLLKTTDNTIPAGAFAKVVLLGGVDASTSIQASSDPRPVLLRLISPGTLPRKFRSDLEDCHALAACYGDLSSERVFMRLEKLTCVERKTGEVLEMNVQGYVAGEDGRAGLRGRLVDRSTESLRNAMLGGFFSSVGNFLGQSRQPVVFSPTAGLAQTNPLSAQEMLNRVLRLVREGLWISMQNFILNEPNNCNQLYKWPLAGKQTLYSRKVRILQTVYYVKP